MPSFWEVRLVFCIWSSTKLFRKEKKKDNKEKIKKKELEKKKKEQKRGKHHRPAFIPCVFFLCHNVSTANLPPVGSYCCGCLDFFMLVVLPHTLVGTLLCCWHSFWSLDFPHSSLQSWKQQGEGLFYGASHAIHMGDLYI